MNKHGINEITSDWDCYYAVLFMLKMTIGAAGCSAKDENTGIIGIA